MAKNEPNVYLFVPNLIGFSRVILVLVSLYFMSWHPNYSTVLYLVSSLLDAFDGWAARRLGQTTNFGAILDMVTDRCATSCLLCFLSSAYPKYTVVFQLLVSLDLASHYMHMYATLHLGAKSHKTMTKKHNWMLRMYYGNNKVLFLFCAANEMFFVALYLLSFAPRTPPRLGYLAVPTFISKRGVLPLSYPTLMAAVCGPICFAKQVINVVQLANAANSLVKLDVAERVAPKKKE
ncbi:CDP-diacylglycerol-inositol 3- phosphatidyltransferase Pis1 [Schizosaccharomyces japonicus yFS275]|uniref:CDP-diacylglycerol--inositol 3-phosphatidyltransferase n=1 Tax=Schizosaccharomyces japonicus (strain yFS275 / FY16936) TaxID=402676 RepID=B6JX71_SCHJY|nr:CDP-diacylglycerol-inositol 3- phosphatidyltransferase Pis1 [Schizosaccharomyces japonicus yFS275]EEB05972.1 CDP-diacylglycerol-inositol 3- phosphatidyltransferase Pis1 [Schizosaccharomyces japonicus yFS275]